MSLIDRIFRRSPKGGSEIENWTIRAIVLSNIQERAPHVIGDLENKSAADWAAAWFDSQPWAEKQARETKDAWGYSPTSRKNRDWAVLLRGMEGVIETFSRTFEYESWNPQREEYGGYKNRVLAEFATQIDGDSQEDRRGKSWHRIPGIRNLDRDAEWFVRYQFCDESPAAIARSVNADQTSADRTVSAGKVSEAIRRLADRLGVRAKSEKRVGRPPHGRK